MMKKRVKSKNDNSSSGFMLPSFSTTLTVILVLYIILIVFFDDDSNTNNTKANNINNNNVHLNSNTSGINVNNDNRNLRQNDIDFMSYSDDDTNRTSNTTINHNDTLIRTHIDDTIVANSINTETNINNNASTSSIRKRSMKTEELFIRPITKIEDIPDKIGNPVYMTWYNLLLPSSSPSSSKS